MSFNPEFHRGDTLRVGDTRQIVLVVSTQWVVSARCLWSLWSRRR